MAYEAEKKFTEVRPLSFLVADLVIPGFQSTLRCHAATSETLLVRGCLKPRRGTFNFLGQRTYESQVRTWFMSFISYCPATSMEKKHSRVIWTKPSFMRFVILNCKISQNRQAVQMFCKF